MLTHWNLSNAPLRSAEIELVGMFIAEARVFKESGTPIRSTHTGHGISSLNSWDVANRGAAAHNEIDALTDGAGRRGVAR